MKSVRPYTIQVSIPEGGDTDQHLFAPEGQLAVDVYTRQDMVHIVAPIAGADTDSIDVHVHNDILTIRGNRPQPHGAGDASAYHQECFWGVFSRTIVLPVPVLAEKAEAVLDRGLLTISIPKQARDRSIPITIVEE
jgi:HSP20 family protein